MVPLYAIVVAPLVRPAGVPLVMWWSHWKMDARRPHGRAGLHAGRHASARATFPGASKKLVTVGQAIDVESFPARSGERARRARCARS